MAVPRLTRSEEAAILVALAQTLAGPVLDGFMEGEPQEAQIRREMLSAQAKLWSREEARENR